MNAKQKSVFTGAILAIAVMVFMPNTYVWISTKLGKLARVQNVEG